MHALLQLTDSELADMRREAVQELKADLIRDHRARALDELTSFSAEEIAVAKGISVPKAKGLMTRYGISKEKLGYKTKRHPLRELRVVFDECTIKGLVFRRFEQFQSMAPNAVRLLIDQIKRDEKAPSKAA